MDDISKLKNNYAEALSLMVFGMLVDELKKRKLKSEDDFKFNPQEVADIIKRHLSN